jgi:hypothetical protein
LVFVFGRRSICSGSLFSVSPGTRHVCFGTLNVKTSFLLSPECR